MKTLGLILSLVMLVSCEERTTASGEPRLATAPEICKDTIIKCDFNDNTEHRSCPHPSQIVEVVKGEGYFWGGCRSDATCICRCPKATAPTEPAFK